MRTSTLADRDLLADVENAQALHDQERRCGTSAKLVGSDGPCFSTLMAARRVADALADEFDAPADQIASCAQRTMALLAAYREARDWSKRR